MSQIKLRKIVLRFCSLVRGIHNFSYRSLNIENEREKESKRERAKEREREKEKEKQKEKEKEKGGNDGR